MTQAEGGGGHLMLSCEFALSCSGQGKEFGRGPMVSFSAHDIHYIDKLSCAV